MTSSEALRLHFQCSFELHAGPDVADPWSDLAKTFRRWITEAPLSAPPPTNPGFFGSWYFTGGEWRGPGPGYHRVLAARLIGAGSDREPEHWAVEYEHNCEVPARVWRTDAGITRLGDRKYRVSLVTSHYMRAGFIGREPSPPAPTAPRVVGWLLRGRGWQAFAGSEELRTEPLALRNGEGEAFRARLKDAARECPIILVSRDFASGEPLLDARQLARLLAGSATVYLSDSSSLDKELEWCLGRRFSCWNGMVRVYQPELRFDHPAAPKRQRYFSGREICKLGEQAVTEMLVHGIARRAHRRPFGVVSSIVDVATFEREQRMLALKAAAADRSNEEWTQLLEHTNVELEATVKTQEQQISQLREDVADRDDRLARLETGKKVLAARAAEAERVSRTLRQRAETVSALAELPDSLKAVTDLIARIHPERIAFTERAVHSAEDCRFDRIDDAWRCFWAMATTLHSMFFSDGDKPPNIEKAFLNDSGFFLAMTEGELTKNDRKLMRLREDTFQGLKIDITPHVKLDKDTTRAYFCPVRHGATQLIVVGFIGHLRTAGTRRRGD